MILFCKLRNAVSIATQNSGYEKLYNPPRGHMHHSDICSKYTPHYFIMYLMQR